MTVLGALRRSGWENAEYPLSHANVIDLLGGARNTKAGVALTEQRAYGLTAFYRAVALIAGVIAGLPLKVYQNDSRTRSHVRTVLDSPNPAQTPFEFWQTLGAHAATWGHGYARLVRNRADIVVEAWPVHPSAVTVTLVDESASNPAGRLFTMTGRSGRQIQLTSWDMFELPYMSIHGVTGMPPLRLAREVLGIQVAAEETSARFYGQGSRLGGVLQTDKKLGDPDVKRLRSSWRAKHQGVENSHEVAILDNGLTFHPITVPPEDAQLLESRVFGVDEIARLFGIPPHMLGSVEKSTSWGTGIEQQTIAFVQFTMQPWLKLIEQRVTRQLLPGGWTAGSRYAEFALEGLLRGDSQARGAFYHQAITDGWMTRNEVRARENLEPEDGLDEFLIPSNLTLISVDGQLVPLSAKGQDAATS